MNHLLTVKLYAPPLRPGTVHRLRLLQKMNAGLQEGRSLTLITAPAGYGKTTLTLEWLAQLDRAYGWLSLDQSDNHPLQFLHYLIGALKQVDGNAAKALDEIWEQQRHQDEVTRVHSLLVGLVNQSANVEHPFILVLDDYHTITDLAVHKALEFVMEHQPPQMHLVIVTRQDPFLPLSKLRSKGRLTEIRLGELRFTQEETGQFLNGSMSLALLPDEVAALQGRTEGWIAGLQLAALSLSELPGGSDMPLDGETRSGYIQAFAGDDRHVADYLLDEVLSRQPEKIQRFLLHTSILKRLSGPLCDALLEDELESSQEILEQLDRSNLFIIPLDNRRQWYRYHHLFADLLFSRLQSAMPAVITGLHRAASQWFESGGMVADAVDHALLAEDIDNALRLIEEVAGASIWASGELPVLLNWSKRLPEDALTTRPQLCLYCARALFFNGQVEMAERYLQAAENALKMRRQTGDGADELHGVLYTNQATVRAMRGESDQALDLADRARGLIPETDVSTRARIAHAVGMAHFLKGQVSEAEAVFSEAVQLAAQANNRNLRLDLVACLALTRILAGRLGDAQRLCQSVLDQESQTRAVPVTCAIFFALALIDYQRNDLLPAREKIETSIELAQKAGWLHILWQAYLLQSQIWQALGEEQNARQAVGEAEQVALRYRIPRVARIISAFRANLALASRNPGAAISRAELHEDQTTSDQLRDFEELTEARIFLWRGERKKALSEVNRTLQKAESAGRMATVIEARILKARLLDAAGDSEAGLELMSDAIGLAEPESFVRAFLQEGQPVKELLLQLRRRKLPANVMSFCARLLEGFGENVRAERSSLPDGLVEPLSKRELEVLRLIADGLSNPEIAARLYLSVNTLRAHTSHIFQKLAVHNRVQAVSRARQLRLLAPE